MTAVQQKPDSRSRILTAARHLFASRGFHQTAMSELAAEAQISVGQIYRSFKNKNDVIVAIVTEDSVDRLGDFQAILDKVRAGEVPIAKAFEMLALAALCKSDGALVYEILAESHRNPSVTATLERFFVECRPTLRGLVCEANPEMTERDLIVAEELLLACLFGLSNRPSPRPDIDAEETAVEISRMIMKALSAL